MIRQLACLFACISSLCAVPTATPIKHLIVIYQENRSFDHYFGTYPSAENRPGETPFYARKNTPSVNGLNTSLMTNNQNLVQPFRLSASDDLSDSDPIHRYSVLQLSMHRGLMDKFVQRSGASCPDPNIVMGYFDGNTVTALWNYAQYFCLNDNCFTTTPTSSFPGAINLISGQTHGAIPDTLINHIIDGTMINNVVPLYDMCSEGDDKMIMTGINVGNLLNDKGVTWGWFSGGFSDCSATHIGPRGPTRDYGPGLDPFQYYESTSNPNHLPPTSLEMVGKTDQANHNYDINDFWAAAEIGNIPSVCFFKAPRYQDAHPVSSSPTLEQSFLAATINKLQTFPQWKDMAIIITYDDCGGWYDHVYPPIINNSQTYADHLSDDGESGTNAPMGGYQGRPGYGNRIPFLLISPWAKSNFVDHTLIDQTSVLRFIEDNWFLGRIGDYSFDEFAGSLLDMFNFSKRKMRYLMLHPENGAIQYSSE